MSVDPENLSNSQRTCSKYFLQKYGQDIGSGSYVGTRATQQNTHRYEAYHQHDQDRVYRAASYPCDKTCATTGVELFWLVFFRINEAPETQ